MKDRIKEIILKNDFNYIRELLDYHQETLNKYDGEMLPERIEELYDYRQGVEEEINKLRIQKLKTTFPEIKCIHLSPKPLYKNMLKNFNQEVNFDEPRGLYYSTNYKRYTEGNYNYKYMYGIIFNQDNIYSSIDNFNPNLILKINSKKELFKFMSIFMTNYKQYIQNKLKLSKKKIKSEVKVKIGGKSKKNKKNVKTDEIKLTKNVEAKKVSVEPIINFKYLSKCYAGIEFAYNGEIFELFHKKIKKKIYGSLGYFAIQDYGCIWNCNIIKDLKLMYLIPEGFNFSLYNDLHILNSEVLLAEKTKKKFSDDKNRVLNDFIDELTTLRDKVSW